MTKSFDEIKKHLYTTSGRIFYPPIGTMLSLYGGVIKSIEDLGNGKIIVHFKDDGTAYDYSKAARLSWKLFDLVERAL